MQTCENTSNPVCSLNINPEKVYTNFSGFFAESLYEQSLIQHMPFIG
jgi:hypothetical protein